MVMDAMINTVNSKYRQLVEYLCQLENGSSIEFDKIFNLVQSIHKDEISLIVNLYELEQLNHKPELKIPSFMSKKRA